MAREGMVLDTSQNGLEEAPLSRCLHSDAAFDATMPIIPVERRGSFEEDLATSLDLATSMFGSRDEPLIAVDTPKLMSAARKIGTLIPPDQPLSLLETVVLVDLETEWARHASLVEGLGYKVLRCLTCEAALDELRLQTAFVVLVDGGLLPAARRRVLICALQ